VDDLTACASSWALAVGRFDPPTPLRLDPGVAGPH
jgi:hypothetical protein